jgi:hypothetical protein
MHRVSTVVIAHGPINRDGDALGNLAHIIEIFMPDYLKRQTASSWWFPKDLHRFSMVYELYLNMLDTASKHGVAIVRSATPAREKR